MFGVHYMVVYTFKGKIKKKKSYVLDVQSILNNFYDDQFSHLLRWTETIE